jgi:hypothetical protein
MSIRRLIEQALNEARDEFAEIVQRKLEALMGDAESASKAPRPARRVSAKTSSAKTPSAKVGTGGARERRKRAPESHMAELRAKILGAMPAGESLKRSQIVELAGLADEDALRISGVLKKLKDEGVISMRGEKAAATYTRKG